MISKVNSPLPCGRLLHSDTSLSSSPVCMGVRDEGDLQVGSAEMTPFEKVLQENAGHRAAVL